MQKDFITKCDKNRIRSWHRYILKFGVEQIESNGEFF